jgi:hypothetical protein
MQRLFGRFDLFVRKIPDNGVGGGKGQLNRLENAGCVLGQDIQRGLQLFVGMVKCTSIVEPARITKNRHRDDD